MCIISSRFNLYFESSYPTQITLLSQYSQFFSSLSFQYSPHFSYFLIIPETSAFFSILLYSISQIQNSYFQYKLEIHFLEVHTWMFTLKYKYSG